MMCVQFKKIDMNVWKRAPYFNLYTKMIPTGFSITVNLDVTKMYKYFKEKGYRFAIGYRYITTKLINEREYFRISYKDGELGVYEYLMPSYVNFHEDDKTTSIMWVDYKESFKEFMDLYIEEDKKYKEVHGIVAKPMMPPENSCIIGVLPWTEFSSYTPTPYAAPTQFFPVLQAGQLNKDIDRITMPFSITVSHAVVDGYQVSEYINALQNAINTPEDTFD